MAPSRSIPQALDTFSQYWLSARAHLHRRGFSAEKRHNLDGKPAKSPGPARPDLVINLSVSRQQNDLVTGSREIVLTDTQAMVAVLPPQRCIYDHGHWCTRAFFQRPHRRHSQELSLASRELLEPKRIPMAVKRHPEIPNSIADVITGARRKILV